MKRKYTDRYKTHQIQAVVGNTISPVPRDIGQFSVKLKISEGKAYSDSPSNEAWEYVEKQKIIDDDDNIEMDKLIDKDRVTFIRGIAGTGKSVLAKQIAYNWANGEMYGDFELCIIFECRYLNSFLGRKAGTPIRKLFEDFLKEIFSFDLRDESKILFVVDGLDELADIDLISESIINELLFNGYRYVNSKIIVTGRPHVESKLRSFEMGGIRTLEIQGLSDAEIKKYIEKFPCDGYSDVQIIKKARSLSKRNLPILHVPQFLNTFCCVAILTNGKQILSHTELYCWVLFLLLREHDADKCLSGQLKFVNLISDIYLTQLVEVSRVCYELLQTKRVIFEKKPDSMIDVTSAVKGVLKSLFVDVSDHSGEKYQFIHLSLMEFFSAIHICTQDDPISTIQDNLKKKFVQVVLFVCGIIGGSSTNGIIKGIFDKILSPTVIFGHSFVEKVVEAVDDCRLQSRIKFEMAMEIIVYFLHHVTDPASLKPIIQRFLCIGTDSSARVSSDLLHICHYLRTECSFSEREIQDLFKNCEFRWFFVKNIHNIECIKYFQQVSAIKFQYIRVDCIKVQKAVNEAVANCNKVFFEECVFKNNKALEDSKRPKTGKLKMLEIKNCTFNDNSFGYICNVAMSSEIFMISKQALNDDWNRDILKAITDQKETRDFHLEEIHIYKCSFEITQDLKDKVRKYFIL